MKIAYVILTAGLFFCCLTVAGLAQAGDTQNATGKTPAGVTGKAPVGAMGKAPVGAMGKAPVGAMGKAPVGAMGSLGSGSVTRQATPRDITESGTMQGATGGMKHHNEPGSDNADDHETR